MLSGCYTAMVTPFEGEKLDLNGFIENVRFQVASGVDGIVVLGTTGEEPTLSQPEAGQLVRAAVEYGGDKVQIIVGTGANSTAKTIERTAWAKSLGADAALVIAPYYNRPSQRGLYEHYEAVARNIDLPIIVYNHPPRTGVNIEPMTLLEITQIPNIVAFKQSNPALEQVSDIIGLIERKDFAILSGNDEIGLPMMALGGHGFISVAGNLIPHQMVELVSAMNGGRLEEARMIHYRLHGLFKGLTFEINPVPIKEAMEMCGRPAGQCRLPLTPLSEAHRDSLHQILADAELLPARAGR